MSCFFTQQWGGNIQNEMDRTGETKVFDTWDARFFKIPKMLFCWQDWTRLQSEARCGRTDNFDTAHVWREIVPKFFAPFLLCDSLRLCLVSSLWSWDVQFLFVAGLAIELCYSAESVQFVHLCFFATLQEKKVLKRFISFFPFFQWTIGSGMGLCLPERLWCVPNSLPRAWSQRKHSRTQTKVQEAEVHLYYKTLDGTVHTVVDKAQRIGDGQIKVVYGLTSRTLALKMSSELPLGFGEDEVWRNNVELRQYLPTYYGRVMVATFDHDSTWTSDIGLNRRQLPVSLWQGSGDSGAQMEAGNASALFWRELEVACNDMGSSRWNAIDRTQTTWCTVLGL